ncbi:MAG: hypothetical protein NC124_16765, partial [Clostridium sp.]|nr:hypothetical protein [Clostridium sp.]
MSIPFKKYGYELNPITDEYKTPQIFLVNKRLKKIGELYPIESLKITVNEINQADEISFIYHRKTDSAESPHFDQVDDLSVVFVEDYGYFEISVDKNENSSITKNIAGISLGHAELSQILTTLEINTEDDIARTDYDKNYPTVFYRDPDSALDDSTKKQYTGSSLLHRILSCAPHYKIGYVADTLKYIQRTFSWNDTDIISIFNDIAREINCVFDIEVYTSEDGKPHRIINVYDLQYCKNCYDGLDNSGKVSANTYQYHNIVNGVCQNCGSPEHIVDIGADTNIFISTENLSDDISIQGDKDSIKNCFKIVGGDDMITNTVTGLNMSASGRIMMFSDKQKSEMSSELKTALDRYDREYRENITDYEKLLETEYNITDIRHYLRSSRMPPLEREILTTDAALGSVIQKITEYYHNRFFISSYEKYQNHAYESTRTSIQNLFTTFMPEGYSFVIDYDGMTEKTEHYDPSVSYQWYGTIRVYSTGNRDDNYTIHLQPDKKTFVTHGENNETYRFDDPELQNIMEAFSISFSFADQSPAEYRDYIEQHTKYILSQADLSYENEQKKPWDLYSYNRLKSFCDGYQGCIEVLEEMERGEIDGSETGKLIRGIIENYQHIRGDILLQMGVLLDQLFAISTYYGEYDNDFVDAEGKVTYTLQYYSDIPMVYDHIIDQKYQGGYENGIYKINEFIGTKPFQCKKCGSSNVSESASGNICNNSNCGSTGSAIRTYLDLMKNICDSYNDHKNNTVTNMRKEYQDQFEMGNYLDDELYAELKSFIREDVYQNENYTSDGLNNSQIIEKAKELMAKAEQELSKACTTQYTVDMPVSSIVGQKSFIYHGVLVNDDYSDFKINNFVRVRIDGEVKKMRIATIGLTFPITDKIDVTFTNVTNSNGASLGDVKDILNSAKSMATSYHYVATQAESGNNANDKFNSLTEEGLDASLISIMGGRDQDVVIDDHGILLRRKDPETGVYSPLQMKLIDRNIVMTSDAWEHADLAIGLGMYNGEQVYGIWTKLLCGDLMITKTLHVKNDSGSVVIDENGIDITNGSMKITNENGCTVVIDPLGVYQDDIVFGISKKGQSIVSVDRKGNAIFNGKVYAEDGSFVGTVTANKGFIGTKENGWEIDGNSITNTGSAEIYTEDPKNGSFIRFQSGCLTVKGTEGTIERKINLINGAAWFEGRNNSIAITNDMIEMQCDRAVWLKANMYEDVFYLGRETTKTCLYGAVTAYKDVHFKDRVYYGDETYLFTSGRPSDNAETLFCSVGLFTNKSVAIGGEYAGSSGSPYMLSVNGSVKVAKEVYTD